MIANINNAQQWILELNAIFLKAIIWQKIRILSVVQNNNDHTNKTYILAGTDHKTTSLYDRILLINGDYININ
jgi:hypothetical protein